MLEIVLFALVGLLLLFAEELLKPLPALIFALLFQLVFMVLNKISNYGLFL